MKIDKLIHAHFNSPEDFGEAMRRLKQYLDTKEKDSSFEAYEELSLSLDPRSEALMDRSLDFFFEIQSEIKKIHSQLRKSEEEREFLKNIAQHLASQSEASGGGGEVSVSSEVSPPSDPQGDTPTLRDCFEKWDSMNHGPDKRRPVELFCRLMWDAHSDDVTLVRLGSEDMRAYHSLMEGIPKSLQTAHLSISEIKSAKGPPRSPKTILDDISYAVGFLNWIYDKGYDLNPKIITVLKRGSDVKKTPQKTRKRLPYSDEEMATLFHSKHYRTVEGSKTSATYWASIIACFTGARMSEILSLEKHNIKRDNRYAWIEILEYDHESQDEQKRIKASGSERTVPIHQTLIDLGFLDYVSAVSGRLFPDEERNSKGKFDAFQKRHTRIRKDLGLVPPNNATLKDFHSFRHTVRTRLSDLRREGKPSTHFDEGTIDAIVGHESVDRSIGSKVYTHSDQMKTKTIAINKLVYAGVDWDSVIRWDKMRFVREMRRNNQLA